MGGCRCEGGDRRSLARYFSVSEKYAKSILWEIALWLALGNLRLLKDICN